MANLNDTMNALLKEADGAIIALLGDSDSGMLLASAGSGLDMEIAAAGTTEFMRAKLKTVRALKLDDQLEDILVTLGSQYHIIRPLSSNRSIFIYLSVDRERSNLALARIAVKNTEQKISL